LREKASQAGSACAAPLARPRLPLRVYVPAGLLLTALIVACYLPIVLQGLCLAEGEGVIYYLPLRELVAEHWRAGRWPLWNPYTFAGMPLLADCQAGALYPPNLLFLVLPPVPAMNVLMLLTHTTTAWGMLFLLREYRVGAWAALIGSATLTFSSFMVAHMGHVTVVNAACWLPWLCWAAHRYCATRHSGYPQLVVYSVITVGMMVVMLAVRRFGRSREWVCVAGLVASLALGGLLAGAQVVPSVEMSRLTGRPLEANASVYGHYHLPPSHTPLLWFPQLLGAQCENPFSPVFWGRWNFVETAGYAGLLPWMLLAAAWATRGAGRFGRGWALIGLAHLVLAWGPRTPLGWALYYVPLYNSFQAPGRHLLGLALALGVCAAVGAQALIEADSPRRRRLAASGAGLLLVIMVSMMAVLLAVGWGYHFALGHLSAFAGALGPPPSRSPIHAAPVALIMPIALAALSAGVLIVWARWQTRWGRVALAAVLFIDLGLATSLCAWAWRHRGQYRIASAPAQVAELLARPGPGEPPPRYVLFGPWGETYALNAQGNIRQRFASLHGYGPFQLRRYAEVAGGMTHGGELDDEAFLGPHHRGLDLLSGRYVIVQCAVGRVEALEAGDRYVERCRFNGARVLENLRARPRAWVVHEHAVLNTARDVRRAIETGLLPGGRPFDPGRVALLDAADVPDGGCLPTAGPAPGGPAAAGAASVTWQSYETDLLSLTVMTERAGLLVLSEPFDAGWRARVDGSAAAVLRVNHMLRAVRVPAGTHQVELRYEPASLRIGLTASGVGVLAVLALLARTVVAPRSIRRRRPV